MSDGLQKFQESCTTVAQTIYKDIDLKIAAVTLCLGNVGLAVRYRAEIFGVDDDAAIDASNYITTTMEDVAILTDAMADILDYGAYYNHGEDKDRARVEYELKTAQITARAREHIDAVVEHANTLQTPSYFTRMPPVPDPKKKIATVAEQLKLVFLAVDMSASMRLGMADRLVEFKNRLNANEPGLSRAFRESTAMYETYRDICKGEQKPMQDMRVKYQFNGFN